VIVVVQKNFHTLHVQHVVHTQNVKLQIH